MGSVGFWGLWFLFAYTIIYSDSGRLAEVLSKPDNFGVAMIFLFVGLWFLVLGSLEYASTGDTENSSPLKNNSDTAWQVTTKTETKKTAEQATADKG